MSQLCTINNTNHFFVYIVKSWIENCTSEHTPEKKDMRSLGQKFWLYYHYLRNKMVTRNLIYSYMMPRIRYLDMVLLILFHTTIGFCTFFIIPDWRITNPSIFIFILSIYCNTFLLLLFITITNYDELTM